MAVNTCFRTWSERQAETSQQQQSPPLVGGGGNPSPQSTCLSSAGSSPVSPHSSASDQASSTATRDGRGHNGRTDKASPGAHFSANSASPSLSSNNARFEVFSTNKGHAEVSENFSIYSSPVSGKGGNKDGKMKNNGAASPHATSYSSGASGEREDKVDFVNSSKMNVCYDSTQENKSSFQTAANKSKKASTLSAEEKLADNSVKSDLKRDNGKTKLPPTNGAKTTKTKLSDNLTNGEAKKLDHIVSAGRQKERDYLPVGHKKSVYSQWLDSFAVNSERHTAAPDNPSTNGATDTSRGPDRTLSGQTVYVQIGAYGGGARQPSQFSFLKDAQTRPSCEKSEGAPDNGAVTEPVSSRLQNELTETLSRAKCVLQNNRDSRDIYR